ncbi:MAG: M60 family metallopeptidase [Pigmentiphaga sp.]|nr:M60 family metallopeptidase [Pigmentiphaga sp.]
MRKQKAPFILCIYLRSILVAGILFFSVSGYARHQSFDPLTIFTELSCSELKAGITLRQINRIPDSLYKTIATQLYDGSYPDAKYRIQTYRVYQTPKVSATRTKTLHTWGILDNVTGIYVEKPEDELYILVGETRELEVKLRVQDFTQAWGEKTFPLHTGLNIVKPGIGLCYMLIFQDTYIPLNPTNEVEREEIDSKSVKIHFVTGRVNGYYDITHNTGEESDALITHAQYPYFDVKGKYSQLVWYTEDFREAHTDLSKTITYLDQLVGMEIDFAGFFKYSNPYSTRMFFMPSISGKGNPNATVERVIFPKVYKNFFANPSEETLLNRAWGIAHEVGHCSQSNPGLRWGGMGEVGNNLFSMYVKTQLFGYTKSNMLVENYYEKAKALIIDAKIAHADLSIVNHYFERLVPFWQLHLYTANILGYTDLYRDLYEHYRTTPDVGTTFANSGLLQLDFIRNVCNLTKTNFLDFFKKWGFLAPIDVVVNDYGKRILKITQQDIDSLIEEIESCHYSKPTHDITTIRDDNFYQFRN